MDANIYVERKAAAKATVTKVDSDNFLITETKFDENSGEAKPTTHEIILSVQKTIRDATQRDLNNLNTLITDLEAL